MNRIMLPRVQPVFNSGDRVQERDSDIWGLVSGPGEHPGEWRIVCADGSEMACLGENLFLASEKAAGRYDPPRSRAKAR